MLTTTHRVIFTKLIWTLITHYTCKNNPMPLGSSIASEQSRPLGDIIASKHSSPSKLMSLGYIICICSANALRAIIYSKQSRSRTTQLLPSNQALQELMHLMDTSSS